MRSFCGFATSATSGRTFSWSRKGGCQRASARNWRSFLTSGVPPIPTDRRRPRWTSHARQPADRQSRCGRVPHGDRPSRVDELHRPFPGLISDRPNARTSRSIRSTSAACTATCETTETFRTLAGATDGYAAVNSNDIAAGFRRVADQAHVVLPPRLLLDEHGRTTASSGRSRSRSTRPGVSVAARRGYLAPPSDAVVAAARAAAAAAAGPAVPDDVAGAFERLARLGSDQEVFASAADRPRRTSKSSPTSRSARWIEADGRRAPASKRRSPTVPERHDRPGVHRTRPARGDRSRAVRRRAEGSLASSSSRDGCGRDPSRLGSTPTRPAAGRLGPPARAPRRRAGPRTHAACRSGLVPAQRATSPAMAARTGHCAATAQILDRRGQPLGTSLPATEGESSGGRIVTFDCRSAAWRPATT